MVTEPRELGAGGYEATERVIGGAHDWLSAHVEAGIDQHRTAVQSIEARDQGVIPRIGVGVGRRIRAE